MFQNNVMMIVVSYSKPQMIFIIQHTKNVVAVSKDELLHLFVEQGSSADHT